MMRILQVNPQYIKKMMREIRVDPYGAQIMLPKAITYLIRMNSVSNITANILKQEMLSLGGDVAVARAALTGKTKKTDCLLMGSLSQFSRLNQKLSRQPFGLDKLAGDLSCALTNYQREGFLLDLGRHKLELKGRACIMGIVNLTPDSFSGDGLYSKLHIANRISQISKIVEYIYQMVADGADIIDLGGESSRPGAKPVSVKEELKRTIPVIKAVSKKINIPLSIDTYKPEVARCALDNGAAIVNDITGLKDPRMLKLAAKYKAGVIIMHMKGNPLTMHRDIRYVSLIDEVLDYLGRAVKRSEESGIDRKKIIIDPGLGFGKTAEQSMEILKRLGEFKILGRPILVGPSRKSFLGKILGVGPRERIFGTVAACVLAVKSGAKLVRVHDVKEVAQALKVAEAVNHT